jgi:hypothetical protein
MGYFSGAMVRNSLILWAIIIPVSILVIWGCWKLNEKILAPNMYFSKLLIDSSIFTIFFLAFLLIIDGEVRQMAKDIKTKVIDWLSSRKLRTADAAN